MLSHITDAGWIVWLLDWLWWIFSLCQTWRLVWGHQLCGHENGETLPCLFLLYTYGGCSLVVECYTQDENVTGLISCRSSRRIFFSRVNFQCWPLFWHAFHPRVTAVASKKKKEREKKNPVVLTKVQVASYSWACKHPWFNKVWVGWREPITQEMSTYTTHQGTLGHSHLSSLSHCGPILV